MGPVSILNASHMRCEYDKMTWRCFWGRPPARGHLQVEENEEEEDEVCEEDDETGDEGE